MSDAKPVEMRVLTVRQPWAWAIIHGEKNVENRVRNVAGSYRGPVAIHASLAFADGWEQTPTGRTLREQFDDWDLGPWSINVGHLTGVIVGVVDLVGSHVCKSHSGDMDMPVCFDSGTPYAMTCSPWAEFTPGQQTHHLVIRNPRALRLPIPFKGALGLRRLPDDVAEQIRGELEAVSL